MRAKFSLAPEHTLAVREISISRTAKVCFWCRENAVKNVERWNWEHLSSYIDVTDDSIIATLVLRYEMAVQCTDLSKERLQQLLGDRFVKYITASWGQLCTSGCTNMQLYSSCESRTVAVNVTFNDVRWATGEVLHNRVWRSVSPLSERKWVAQQSMATSFPSIRTQQSMATSFPSIRTFG